MFQIHDYPEAYVPLGDIADSNHTITPEEKEKRTVEAAEIIF
jgi:hypothetical protein